MWVSQQAAFRSTDDWKDCIMIKKALGCIAVLKLDAEKIIILSVSRDASRGNCAEREHRKRGG
jgi:hypothetical protein